MTTRPVEARRPAPPESAVEYVPAAVEPLAGISSPLLTAAARRVAQRVREEAIEPADSEAATALLAAYPLPPARVADSAAIRDTAATGDNPARP